MVLTDNVADLLGRIYSDSGHDDGLKDVLDDIARLTGSRRIFLAVPDLDEHSLVSTFWRGDLDSAVSDGIEEYQAGVAPMDPTFAFLSENRGAGLFDSASYFTRNSHEAHPYIPWNQRYMGISHWLVGYAGDARNAGLGLAVHPQEGDSPYRARERAIFRLAFEHIQRASRLWRSLPAIAASKDAIVLVDATGFVQQANAAAEKVFSRQDGLAVRAGRLAAWRQNDQRTLLSVVASAADVTRRGVLGSAVLIERPSGRRPLAVLVDLVPPKAGLARFSPAALLRIVDTDAAPPPGVADRWRNLWGLTAAEARLAHALVENGCDLRAAGETLCITYATVRTQLASIFAKTGTNGQPELMRLLTRVSG